LVSACSQSPNHLVKVAQTPNQPNTQNVQNLGLTLSNACKMMQATASTIHIMTLSSLFNFYQFQDQLAPNLSGFFKKQNAALSLVEKYWELAILNTALEQIWLEQKKLMPVSSAPDSNQNLVNLDKT
tara:strand:- start:1000 stop:1380 length:381 start_codon:yes stop_codon:yes gene_type:complete